MSTILIKADNQSNKILSEFVKKLDGNIVTVNEVQLENLMLGNLMDSVKTGKTVSKNTILNKLRGK